MKKKIILGFALLLLAGNLYATGSVNTGVCPVNNPYHLLVNKSHSLSSSYIPSNLVMPNVNFASPGKTIWKPPQRKR